MKMKNVKFIKDLNSQINKRERNLAKYEREIGILKAALKIMQNNGSDNENEEVNVVAEVTDTVKRGRGSLPGVKRGSYKKRRKKHGISKEFRKKVVQLDWRKELPVVLNSSGKALSTAEIINKMFPGAHKKTKRVHQSRCSAMLSLLRNEGAVKSIKEPGKRATYINVK